MSQRRENWVAGLVVGAVTGVLTLTFPILGYAILLVFALLLIRTSARTPAVGGLFVGLGATWLALLIRSHLACIAFDAAPGRECLDPDIGPWLIGGAVLLGIGIATTAVAMIGTRRG